MLEKLQEQMEALTMSFESGSKAAANTDQQFASTITKGINFAPPPSKGAMMAPRPPSKGGLSSAGKSCTQQ